MNPINSGKRISDQVFDSLLQAISSGEIAAGELLPSEHELCELFGVSRPSIKTAVDRLSVLGLVEQKVGKGTFVKERSSSDFFARYAELFIDPEDSENLLSLRMACELEGYRKLLYKAEDRDRKALGSLYEKIQAAFDNKDRLAGETVLAEFHDYLCKGAGNPYLLQLYPITQKPFKAWLHQNYDRLKKEIDGYYQISRLDTSIHGLELLTSIYQPN